MEFTQKDELGLKRTYYVVTEITMLSDSNGSYSAFTGNTTVKTVVFNEGLKIVCVNAFKDCSNLYNDYFSSTVTSVATDAFFLDAGNDDTNKSLASDRRFYIVSGSSVSTSNWTATKIGLLQTQYYGSSKNSWLATKYDYSKAFQTNTYTAFTKSLEIARSL